MFVMRSMFSSASESSRWRSLSRREYPPCGDATLLGAVSGAELAGVGASGGGAVGVGGLAADFLRGALVRVRGFAASAVIDESVTALAMADVSSGV